MGWYEFDENAVKTCRCGWTGATASGDLEITDLVFHWDCPDCGKALAVFSHIPVEVTKRKAAEGNPKAIEELREWMESSEQGPE